MPFTPNSLDLLPSVQQWDVEDINQFAKQDYFLVTNQVKRLQNIQVHQKLAKPWNWTPNLGTTAKFIRSEPSPQLRSAFVPARMNATTLIDKVAQTEVTTYANIYRHKVESNLLNFRPKFVDFNGSMAPAMKDITEKIGYLSELFQRTAIFHGAPFVYVCGYGLVPMPSWVNGDVALSKTAGDVIAACVLGGGVRPLSYQELDRACQVMSEDLGAYPRQGNLVSSGKNEASNDQKWVLVGGREVYKNFIYDTFSLNNRALGRDVVAEGMTGPISPDIDFLAERHPLRYNSITGLAAAPEAVQVHPGAYDLGQVGPNPDYVGSNVTVSFLYGDDPYQSIRVGPPPAAFSGGKMGAEQFAGMDWNGKVRLTGDLLIEVASGVFDTNKHGEYLQYISAIAMGIKENCRRNVLPILSLRTRAGSNL